MAQVISSWTIATIDNEGLPETAVVEIEDRHTTRHRYMVRSTIGPHLYEIGKTSDVGEAVRMARTEVAEIKQDDLDRREEIADSILDGARDFAPESDIHRAVETLAHLVKEGRAGQVLVTLNSVA